MALQVVNYTVQAQLQVQATDPASAGAALDAALAALQAVLAGSNSATPPSFGAPIALQVEEEAGQYVYDIA
jgi:hypothetical protein